MAAHTEKEFEIFMSQLQETNQTLDFFCDFDKISQNVEDIKLSLCMLKILIGSTDMRKSVETIWKRDKSAFKVLDILIAVRSKGRKKVLDSFGNCVVLDSLFESVDGVMEFLDKTGLTKVFQSKKINDLVDYVFGIETGLDSNARKNRSGLMMESHMAALFDKAGVTYKKQVSSNSFPAISAVLGTDQKVFDFAVTSKGKTFLIEVNFYSGGGSKLNEVARSYQGVAPKVNKIPGFEFVWITDGIGWRDASGKLKEAFIDYIPSVYNLTTVNNFISTL